MNFTYVLKRINFDGEVVIGNPDQSYACGRGNKNEIICLSMLVSRQHCIFFIRSDGLYIRDLDSSNGVFVNGEKKQGDTKLEQDDKIGIGFPDVDPKESNAFVYSLQIQNGTNRGRPRSDDVVLPKKEKVEEDVPKSEIPKKKRPVENHESIPPKRLKTEGSYSNNPVPSTNSANPQPSTSSAPSPISIATIKPDPDDDIQILEVFSLTEENGLKTKVSKSSKPEPRPNEVTNKPSKKCTEIMKPEENKIEVSKVLRGRNTGSLINSGKEATEVTNKSSDKCSEISKRFSKRRTELNSKPDEEPAARSRTTTTGDKGNGKPIVRKIEALSPNSSLNLYDRSNLNQSSVKKTQCHVQSKEAESTSKSNHIATKPNQTVPKPESSKDSVSTTKKSNKENLQNGHLTNESVPTSDYVKIKEEPPDVKINNSKAERLGIKNTKSKVNAVPESKQNGNCDKPVTKVPTSDVRISKNLEESMETSYYSDDDLYVVNVIENNGNSDTLDRQSAPVKDEPKSSYSEFDVVSLSSDEEGDEYSFPCSQLFNSVKEEPVEEEKRMEEQEEGVRESYEDDVIVLSDSDDEDNPWFNKLYNSQVYRPSQDFCVKTEPEEEFEEVGNTSLELESPFHEEEETCDQVVPKTSRSLVPETEEQDDDVWDENIQSQETAAKEAKSESKAESKKNRSSPSPRILLDSERPMSSRTEQEVLKPPRKKLKEMPIVRTHKREDSFLNDEVDNEESSMHDRVQQSIQSFDDSCARRKSYNDARLEEKRKERVEDSRKTRKALEHEKERRRDARDMREKRGQTEALRDQQRPDFDDLKRRNSYIDDRRKQRPSEDRESSRASNSRRERQKSSVNDREKGRCSDETRERKKIRDIRERSRETERDRGRKLNHEDTRERSEENEEMRTRRKQEGARKKRREKEELDDKKKAADKKKINFDNLREKKASSEDARETKVCNGDQTRKTIEDGCRRFFENYQPKKNIENEMKKLDNQFENVVQPRSFRIPRVQSVPKPVETIPETPKLAEDILQTSRPAEVASKKQKSWESAMESINELNAKAKLALRRKPVLIEAPYMPKGGRRGISASVFRSNNENTEDLTSKDEEPEDEFSNFEPRKSLPEFKSLRNRSRSRSRNRRAIEIPIRGEKEKLKEQAQKEIRKEKLKELSMKKLPVEENTSVANDRVIRNKAVVKVTHQSRQDALLSDQQKAAAVKPGIAHQRMNKPNVDHPVAHCSKSIPESIDARKEKVFPNKTREKSQKPEDESCFQIGMDLNVNNEQEEMLNDLIPTDLESVSPGELNIQNGVVEKYGSLKLTDVTNMIHDQSKTYGIAKSRKSCLATFTSSTFKQKTKKKVHFNDSKNEVREYQIEGRNSLMRSVHGKKDAQLKNPQKPIYEFKLDEYLSRIFNWNPTWLEEQKNLPNEPPVYGQDKVSVMKNRYSSFSNYCNILRPLLLLEIWEALTKESESEEKKYKFRSLYCSVVENSVFQTKSNGEEAQSKFMIEVLMSQEDLKKDMYPGPGHLIILEFPESREVKDQGGRVVRKAHFRRVFAYVEKKCLASITPNTRFNRELSKLTRDADMLLTFNVSARKCINPPSDKICRLRGAMYLKSNMREILALQHFQTSPLKSLILTPMIEDYQLPEIYISGQNPLVTKDNLNEKQREAVMRISEAALTEKPQISLIHGPPGTGKSKVIVNLVTQILSKDANKKILVCAPSNAAVDELVIRLLHVRAKHELKSIKMVRVGRLDSMNARVKNVSLTELGRKQVEKDFTITEEMEMAFKKNKSELQKKESLINLVEKRIEDVKRNGVKGNILQLSKERQDLQAACRVLRDKANNHVDIKKLNPQEVNRIHRESEEMMLSKASVIACTLSSCYSGVMEKLFGGKRGIQIPICIVDEATQSCETENLIPLMLGVNKLILVGDTNQLPATVLSKKAKEMGLDQSLFARIQKTFENANNSPIIMLDTQYRMDYPILSWPNAYFYQGKLRSAAIVETVPFSSYRVLNLNSNQDESKFSNTVEAEFVAKIIYIMITSVDLPLSTDPLKIGVITPYQSQRHVIMSRIDRRLDSVSSEKKRHFVIEVNTVDSFQGQERDVIIMSCVRSSGIGFMSDRQRLCVALTRAKSSLILCGNFRTFQKDEMWNELINNAKERSIFIDIEANASLDVIKSHVLR